MTLMGFHRVPALPRSMSVARTVAVLARCQPSAFEVMRSRSCTTAFEIYEKQISVK